MAAPQIPNLYLEAMEEPANEDKEPDETGITGMASLRSGLLPKGILEMCPSR